MSNHSQIQKEILHRAIERPFFTKDILSKAPSSIFGEDAVYKEIATIIKRYYQTNSAILSEEGLLTLTEAKLDRLKKSAEEQQEYFASIHRLYEVRDQTDVSVVDEEIEKYIKKHMNMEVLQRLAVNLDDESVMEQGHKDLKEIMLMDVSGRAKEVINIIDDAEYKERLLSTLQQATMSTGIPEIDNLNGGGLGRGELGLILAVSGSGKTLMMMNLGANYVKQRRNVLFIALEELDVQMVLKFEQTILRQKKSSFLTGKTLNIGQYRKLQEFYKEKREYFGNLFFARYSPQTITPAKVEQLISDIMIREGIQLDVVIIDYPDLLRNPESTGNEAVDGGRLMEEMRRIAQDYNVAMWAASQMNRGAFQAEIKTSAHIEGGLRKRNSAEIVLAINQTPEEYKEGFIRLYADKVRNPPDGPYDKMIGLKVIGETMTLRSYADEGERNEHQILLEEIDLLNEQQYKGQKRVSNPKGAVPDFGSEINASINRGRVSNE